MIELSNVTKTYGKGEQATEALKGVSLSIDAGEFVVLLGASGSGKSTLLHVASALDRPDSGSFKFEGRELTVLSDKALTAFRREFVAVIFQQYYLLPQLTVEKNVKLGADLAKNGAYIDILAALGLADKLHKYPHELSGGQQQRVAIARALAKQPKVLFLDEPTGALDEATGRQVLSYISQLQRKLGFAMVMVTHNPNIADMAQTVVRMNSGRIVDIATNPHPLSADEIGW